ncbi:MAG TPA: cupin domain-containing protein [Gaiellaceae bacterium]|nr:cupin domain-containing protein [Gaiellaceae bacterium]
MEIRARDRAEPFTTKDGSTIRELMRAANQTLAEATLAPGEQTERHYHAESEELYYLLAGTGEMEIDNEHSTVRPGDAILIPPGAWHQITAGDTELRFLCCCAPGYEHADTFFE